MSLYPPRHQPFHPHGIRGEDDIVRSIESTQRDSLWDCLAHVCGFAPLSRLTLEQIRAWLFRAEHVARTEGLPADLELLREVPPYLQALLESLNAARQCLEEWLESEICLAILAAAPHGVTAILVLIWP